MLPPLKTCWQEREIESMKPRAYSYIRFSTPEQEKGDSLRRQIALSEGYAKKHGLVLDDSMRLTDKGLSAYRGTHRTKGALGEFLRLAEAGQIPRGSILIVENLDRLSREQVLDALNQFTSIIRAGIKVVTLQDGMEYDEESVNQNWAQLIISITYMARAHDESEAKSKRLSAVWEEKRSRIDERKMTAAAPAWVRLSEDRTEFALIPEAASAVEVIFRKKLEGKGTERIEKELNGDPRVWKPAVSSRNKTGGWRKSYITKILRSRAVIGEFQPLKKGQAVGEPILNYYPPAISPDLFYQVQAVLTANAERNGNAGGRTGKASSLFTHVIKCGLCGSPIHYIDKGKPPKGAGYLHCDRARRLKECSAKAIRYDEFEQLFFENFEELDLSELMPGKDEIQTRLNELERSIVVSRQRLVEISGEIENLADSIARTGDSRVRGGLEARLSKAYDQKDALETQSREYDREASQLRQDRVKLKDDIDEATQVYHLLDSAQNEEDRIALRLRLRRQIQKMVEWVKVYPLQEPYERIQETDESGVVKVMHSRYIDKVRIKFKGSRNLRVLHLKGHSVLVES